MPVLLTDEDCEGQSVSKMPVLPTDEDSGWQSVSKMPVLLTDEDSGWQSVSKMAVLTTEMVSVNRSGALNGIFHALISDFRHHLQQYFPVII